MKASSILISTGLVIGLAGTIFTNSQIKTQHHVLTAANQSVTHLKKEIAKNKVSNTKPNTKVPTQDTAQTKMPTSISAESAYSKYQELAQQYLTKYIEQTKTLNAPLSNVEQNDVLAPLIIQFGLNGVPDVNTSSTKHLLFEPYIYKNPKMSFSKLTAAGKNNYDGLMILTADSINPTYVQFSYNSDTNLITPELGLTKETPPQTVENGNNQPSDVPSSPIFDELNWGNYLWKF